MPRQRLFNMEVDEISLVDRPANQHSSVAIAKRDSGADMPQFEDKDGNLVAEDDFQVGDFLYDSETGEEYRIVDSGDAADLADEYFEDESTAEHAERELVGKAWGHDVAGLARNASMVTRGAARDAREKAGRAARTKPLEGAMRTRAAIGRRPIAAAAGAGAAGAGAGYGKGKFGKSDDSLGQYVLTELSKAHADERVTAVVGNIAKAYDEARAENESLREVLESLVAERDLQAYTSFAKSFGLPEDESELGGLLQRLAYAGIEEQDLEYLGSILGRSGEMSKAFDEIGETGAYAAGSVMGEVEAYAQGMIGKADAGLGMAGAMTEIFTANPDAYDQYLAEQR